MIIVTKLKTKTGEENKMETALKQNLSEIEKEEGTLAFSLHRSQKDPSIFLLYEKYKDSDAFEYHCSTPYFEKMFGELLPILDREPEVETYNFIDAINPK